MIVYKIIYLNNLLIFNIKRLFHLKINLWYYLNSFLQVLLKKLYLYNQLELFHKQLFSFLFSFNFKSPSLFVIYIVFLLFLAYYLLLNFMSSNYLKMLFYHLIPHFLFLLWFHKDLIFLTAEFFFPLKFQTWIL